jgi:hypothetical protein
MSIPINLSLPYRLTNTALTMAEEPTQTSLKMITGGWELEVSVSMEKVPLKIYQETREERQIICWIASEAGKVSRADLKPSIYLLILPHLSRPIQLAYRQSVPESVQSRSSFNHR